MTVAGRPPAAPAHRRIVLTGVTGQVGHALLRSLQPLGEVVPLTSRDLDLADTAAVRRTMAALAPDIIVNPAAWTAVDKAETERERAWAINAAAPAALAEVCKARGALLVHYSTDYVFDGMREGRWREDDATAPINAYGQSKRDGEVAIAAIGCDHLILRTSWVYSLSGACFLRTMVRLAATREHLRIVGDQFGVPTPASFIADVTAQLIARRQADPALAGWSGLLHVAPAGRTNWHDYAVAGLRELHRRTTAATAAGASPAEPLPRPEWQVPRLPTFESIPATAYPTPARRPANSCFDLSRIESVWGLTMPAWDRLLLTVLRDA